MGSRPSLERACRRAALLILLTVVAVPVAGRESGRDLWLRYPLIVKPAREDASSGVDKDSVVFDYDALQARLTVLAGAFPAPYLVEEFVAGSELHVSILGNDTAAVVLPIIEFDFSELPDDYPKIISYDAKWNPLEEVYHRVHSVCPAKISRRVQRTVEEIGLKAYRITGCRDYARIDLRLDAKGRPFVLEVNPNPDLTEGVSFMESAEKAGLSFSLHAADDRGVRPEPEGRGLEGLSGSRYLRIL